MIEQRILGFFQWAWGPLWDPLWGFVGPVWPGVWTLVNPAVFWVLPADANGACATGTVPVFRFSNNRKDFNQRHTLDLSVKRAMINRAWVPDGGGANGTAFCSPI